MAKPISAHLAKYAWRAGAKPRLLIDFPYIEENFCLGSAVTIKDVESGTDGAGTISLSVLVSAGSTFVTNQVSAGDDVVITGGSNDGTYVVDSVTNETTLVISGTWTATDGAMTFSIHRDYKDEIVSPPAFAYNSKREGGLRIVNDISFGIDNHDLFSNFYRSTLFPKPESTPIRCWLIFDDGSAQLNASDRFQIFQGQVDDSPSVDIHSVEINAKSKDLFSDTQIGDVIGFDVLTAMVSKINDTTAGKIKAVVFGDYIVGSLWDSRSGTGMLPFDPTDDKIPVPKLLYLGEGVADDKRYFLASINQLGSYDTVNSVRNIDIIFETSDFPMRLSNATADGLKMARYDDIEGSIIELGVDNTAGKVTNCEMNISCIKDYTVTTNADPNTSVTNEDLMVDWDDVGGKLNISAGSGAGDECYVIIYIQNSIDSFSSDQEVYCGLYAWCGYGGAGAGDADFSVLVQQVNPPVLSVIQTYTQSELSGNTDYDRIIQPTALLVSGSPNIPALKFKITLRKLSADTNKTAQLTIKHVVAYYKGTKIISPTDVLKFGGVGQFIGSWSVGRATGDGYTETHVDDDAYSVQQTTLTDGVTQVGAVVNEFGSAGGDFAVDAQEGDILEITDGNANLVGQYPIKSITSATVLVIEGDFSEADTGLDFQINRSSVCQNGASIVEQLIRDELGLVDAEINMDSFNIASNDVSTSVLKFAVENKPQDTDKFIDDFAKKLKSLIYFDEQNRASMRTFVSTDPFSASNLISEIEDTTGSNWVDQFSYNHHKRAFLSTTNAETTTLDIREQYSDTDGSCTLGGSILGSAGAQFIKDGVTTSSVLIITTGSNAGTYTITTVNATNLVISGTFPVADFSMTFKVQTTISVVPTKDIYKGGSVLASEVATLIEDGSILSWSVGYNITTGIFTIDLDTAVTGAGTLNFSVMANSGASDFFCEVMGFYKGDTHTDITTVDSDFGVFEGMFLCHVIEEDSFKLYRDNKLINDLKITMNDNTVVSYSDATSITDHGTQPDKKTHKYTRDEATADIFGDHIIARNKDKVFTCEFNVLGMTPLIYNQWDFINVRHPVSDGIFANPETEKWKILNIGLSSDSMTTSIIAEHI